MSDVLYKAISASGYRQGSAVLQNYPLGEILSFTPPVPPLVDNNIDDRYTDRFSDQRTIMKRDFRQIDDLALTASVATTPGIDMRKWAGGNIVIPAGSSLTTLTFYASVDGGEFVPLYDSDGVAVTLTVSASKAYPLPDACFGVSDLKITGNTAGNIDIHLKG